MPCLLFTRLSCLSDPLFYWVDQHNTKNKQLFSVKLKQVIITFKTLNTEIQCYHLTDGCLIIITKHKLWYVIYQYDLLDAGIEASACARKSTTSTSTSSTNWLSWVRFSIVCNLLWGAFQWEIWPPTGTTVFPRIEAPGVYWYKRLGPPACIRGPAFIRGNTVLVENRDFFSYLNCVWSTPPLERSPSDYCQGLVRKS